MFYILIVIVMLGCPLRCSSQPRTPYITQSTCQCLSYLSADILACLFGTFGEKLTAPPKLLFKESEQHGIKFIRNTSECFNVGFKLLRVAIHYYQIAFIAFNPLLVSVVQAL